MTHWAVLLFAVMSVNSTGGKEITAVQSHESELLWSLHGASSWIPLVSGCAAFWVPSTASIIGFLFECQRLLTVTPRSGRAVHSVLLEWQSEPFPNPSPCLVLCCPSIPLSLAFFFLPPPLPQPKGVLRRCGVPKWDDFPLFFVHGHSLLFLHYHRERKKPNLTAEWLIQIIVAFSCIGLLLLFWLWSCFSSFHPVQCGIWATGELGPLSKKKKEKKKSDIREREREGWNLSSSVIFCSAFYSTSIACMEIIDKLTQ